MFNKGLVAISLLVGSMSMAHADPATVVQNIKLNENMKGANVSVSESLTETIRAQVPSLNGYVVTVNGVNLLSNEDGTILSHLNASFDTFSMQPLQSVVSWGVFDAHSNDEWFTNPLPEGTVKTGDVYVFTDPTCGYCRKLHSEHEGYEELGLQVHLIPYPRYGLSAKNDGYNQWLSVACSASPVEAYNEVSAGAPVPLLTAKGERLQECVDKISDGYNFGKNMGVSGTPNVIAKAVNGKKLINPGYLPVAQLAEALGIEKATPEPLSSPDPLGSPVR